MRKIYCDDFDVDCCKDSHEDDDFWVSHYEDYEITYCNLDIFDDIIDELNREYLEENCE